MTFGAEVFLPDPTPGFGRVPLAAPPPEPTEDCLIHQRKGAFTRGVAMIHRPTLDLLVETIDQLACRPAARTAKRLPDLTQERLHVLARRFHQYLAASITP